MSRTAWIVDCFKKGEYSYDAAVRMLEANSVSEIEAKKLLTTKAV